MLNDKFFTTEQVANILQVHPFTILKFLKQGKLKGIKLGRVYRIMESDVKEFLEQRMTGGKSQREGAKKEQPQKEEKTTEANNTNNEGNDGQDHYYII